MSDILSYNVLFLRTYTAVLDAGTVVGKRKCCHSLARLHRDAPTTYCPLGPSMSLLSTLKPAFHYPHHQRTCHFFTHYLAINSIISLIQHFPVTVHLCFRRTIFVYIDLSLARKQSHHLPTSFNCYLAHCLLNPYLLRSETPYRTIFC